MWIENLYRPAEILVREHERFPIGEHTHSFYELAYIVSGSGSFSMPEGVPGQWSGDISYGTGTLLLIPPERLHRFKVGTRSRYLFIRFTGSYVTEYIGKDIEQALRMQDVPRVTPAGRDASTLQQPHGDGNGGAGLPGRILRPPPAAVDKQHHHAGCTQCRPALRQRNPRTAGERPGRLHAAIYPTAYPPARTAERLGTMCGIQPVARLHRPLFQTSFPRKSPAIHRRKPHQGRGGDALQQPHERQGNRIQAGIYGLLPSGQGFKHHYGTTPASYRSRHASGQETR